MSKKLPRPLLLQQSLHLTWPHTDNPGCMKQQKLATQSKPGRRLIWITSLKPCKYILIHELSDEKFYFVKMKTLISNQLRHTSWYSYFCLIVIMWNSNNQWPGTLFCQVSNICYCYTLVLFGWSLYYPQILQFVRNISHMTSNYPASQIF